MEHLKGGNVKPTLYNDGRHVAVVDNVTRLVSASNK